MKVVRLLQDLGISMLRKGLRYGRYRASSLDYLRSNQQKNLSVHKEPRKDIKIRITDEHCCIEVANKSDRESSWDLSFETDW